VNHNRALQGYRHKSRGKPIFRPGTNLSEPRSRTRNSTNLARPHKSLTASPSSKLRHSSAQLCLHRLGTLKSETCSTYIDVSLQGRKHSKVEVLEGLRRRVNSARTAAARVDLLYSKQPTRSTFCCQLLHSSRRNHSHVPKLPRLVHTRLADFILAHVC
jgi:hypothetical protein